MFRLLDTDQDGSLSLEEFQKPVKKDAGKLFRACDFNDDNAVDFREFKIMFSNIWIKKRKEEIRTQNVQFDWLLLWKTVSTV